MTPGLDIDKVSAGLWVLGGHAVLCVASPMLVGGSGGELARVLMRAGRNPGSVVGVGDDHGGQEVARGR